MRFTPVDSFESREAKSMYLKGFNYTVHPDNPKLVALAERWLKEGLIKEIEEPRGLVSGQGSVT